jgi:hypothetical protein
MKRLRDQTAEASESPGGMTIADYRSILIGGIG